MAALEVLELDGRPSAVAVGPGGAVLVADDDAGEDAGRLHVRGPSGERWSTVAVGPAPVAIAPAAGGAWVVGATGTVTRVHVSADRGAAASADAPVEIGGALVDAVVLGAGLYVGDIDRGLVHVLEATDGSVAAPPIAVPAGVVRLTADGGRLWVTGLEREVTPIEVATGVPGAPATVGDGPIGLAVADGVVWVANSDDDTVSRVDAVTGASIGEPIPVGDAPIAVSADGSGRVWVLCQDDASIHVLDRANGARRVEPVSLPMRPRGLVVSGAGGWVVGVDPPRVVSIG